MFAHADVDLAAETGQLNVEETATAEVLYQDMREAGDPMSLDEVKTRIVAGELTGAHSTGSPTMKDFDQKQ